MQHSELENYTHGQLKEYTHLELTLGLPGVVYVTDRTQDDVTRWRTLRDKGWARMTDAERREWLGEIVPTPAASKGMYTHRDLNRVENAVGAILVRVAALGYDVPALELKTDWSYTDRFHRDDMVRYLDNIRAIRGLFTVFPNTPAVPSMSKGLDYKQANDIEKILEDVSNVVTNLADSWCYTGEILSGEV